MDSDIGTGQLQQGSLVALFVPMYKNEIPQIAKVVSVPSEGSDLDIEWLQGTYTGVWSTCKRREGRTYVPWVETVKRSDVLFPVKLTKGMRISKATKSRLTQAYADIDL